MWEATVRAAALMLLLAFALMAATCDAPADAPAAAGPAPTTVAAEAPSLTPTATVAPTPTIPPSPTPTPDPTQPPAVTPSSSPIPAPLPAFRIGVMESVTGPGETLGTVAVLAKQMAVEEINAGGGINGRTLELAIEDSKCNTRDAIAAYNKLTDVHGVRIILGTTCSESMFGVAPLAETDGVILFSGSAGHPDIAEAGEYIFRTALSDSAVGVDTANVLWADGIRRLATINESTDYAEELRQTTADHFQSLDGETVGDERYASDTTDFRTRLERLLSAEPDALHIAAQSELAAGIIIKQVRELGFEGPIYSNIVAIGTTALAIAGDAATGVKAIKPHLDPANAKAQEVLATFQDRYDYLALPWFLGSAYDTVHIAAECLKITGDDQDADGFRDCLNDITWRGALGNNYSFDEHGEVVGLSNAVLEVLPEAERTDDNNGYRVLGIAQSDTTATSAPISTPEPEVAPSPTPTPSRISTPTPTVPPTPVPNPDREVLVALYHATDGGNWTANSNWLSDEPLRHWHGVTTDADGRVTELFLEGNRLLGAIPPSLGRLAQLRDLRLDANALGGEIPPALGRLTNLGWLNLGRNQLTGPIPAELSQLSNLVSLEIGNNQLSGEIPPALGRLANLVWLSLSDNHLTGAIPPELGQLSNLGALELGGNRLNGEIPPALARLESLAVLSLANNQLSGTIPPELGRLSELRGLSLEDNQLVGPIPADVGQLTKLRALLLASNQLSGPIPPELGSLASLIALHLQGNQLSGEIPPELGDLASLKILRLSENQLSGDIPPALGNLANLFELWLGGTNQITGCIPKALEDVPVNDLDQFGLPFCG